MLTESVLATQGGCVPTSPRKLLPPLQLSIPLLAAPRRRSGIMGDEWVRLIYTDEADFMEDYWATAEAALALLPGVDWKPNYSKRWPGKRRDELAFEQAVIPRKGDPSFLSGIEVH